MPLSPQVRACDRLATWLLLGPAALAVGASTIAAAPAQSAAAPSVIVDWGALNALAPAPDRPRLAPVTLHPPVHHAIAAIEQAPATTALARPAAPPPAPRPAVKPAAAEAAPALGSTSTIRFARGDTGISPEGRGTLDTVAAELARDRHLRLRLIAHASSSDGDPMGARRLALIRAVELRSYLLDKGVESARMDVRALGERNEGNGPPDRVDIIVLDR